MGEYEVAGVTITRPEKVMFPNAEVTKAQVAAYYAELADWMLPHLADRPVTMQRWPDGVGGFNFFEKNMPDHFPDWIRSVEVDTANGAQRQVVVPDRQSLVYLADQACLTPHVWLSTTAALDRPDQMIFDMDPSSDDLAAIRKATRIIGQELEDLGLTTFLKTTGSRGYHVVVPLRGNASFEQVREFAHGLAGATAGDHADLMTTEQRKDRRGDRVFVDVVRNAYGQTVVPPYALRGRPGAPVATPIDWEELSRVEPDQYDLTAVRHRLRQRSCPWQPLRRHAHDIEDAAAALARR